MELSRMPQALVAAPEAKALTTTESLPAPVLMEELLSMPTESALPPPPHHQPRPLLVALALMLMTSFPDPVWMLVLLIPVVLLLLLFHHHQPPLVFEEALILMRVPKSLVEIKDVFLRAVLEPWLPPDVWL